MSLTQPLGCWDIYIRDAVQVNSDIQHVSTVEDLSLKGIVPRRKLCLLQGMVWIRICCFFIFNLSFHTDTKCELIHSYWFIFMSTSASAWLTRWHLSRPSSQAALISLQSYLHTLYVIISPAYIQHQHILHNPYSHTHASTSRLTVRRQNINLSIVKSWFVLTQNKHPSQ